MEPRKEKHESTKHLEVNVACPSGSARDSLGRVAQLRATLVRVCSSVGLLVGLGRRLFLPAGRSCSRRVEVERAGVLAVRGAKRRSCGERRLESDKP